MSKWATIDREKLEREIDQRSAALDAIGSRTTDPQKAFDGIRILAEHNALVAVFNCISRNPVPAPEPVSEEERGRE